MRYSVNKGLDKYGFKDGDSEERIKKDDLHPRCKDGSLDMRYKVNKGLDKYGENIDNKPKCKDCKPDMRFNVNKLTFTVPVGGIVRSIADEAYQNPFKVAPNNSALKFKPF